MLVRRRVDLIELGGTMWFYSTEHYDSPASIGWFHIKQQLGVNSRATSFPVKPPLALSLFQVGNIWSKHKSFERGQQKTSCWHPLFEIKLFKWRVETTTSVLSFVLHFFQGMMSAEKDEHIYQHGIFQRMIKATLLDYTRPCCLGATTSLYYHSVNMPPADWSGLE